MSMSWLFYHHDFVLVVLSVSLACLTSFIALELAGRSLVRAESSQFAWLTAAGIILGGGIWPMHFLAMSGLPPTIAVNIPGTTLSFLIAILMSTVGLHMAFWKQEAPHRFVLSGGVMGLGMAGAQYTGMAALVMQTNARYDTSIAIVSVFIAIIAATIALWLAGKAEHFALKLTSALVLGLGVYVMHVTGMRAFIGSQEIGANFSTDETSSALAVGGISTAGAILLMVLIQASSNRYLRQFTWEAVIASESERRINALLRNATDLIAVVDHRWIVTYLSPFADLYMRGTQNFSVGQDFLVLFAPRARSQAFTLIENAMETPGKPISAELQGASAVLQEWFEITLNAQTRDLAINGIIVTLRNITEQKRQTEMIEKALDQAREKTHIAERHALALQKAHEETRVAEEYALELEEAHEKTRAAEEQARMLARHDALTGLPNRRVFSAELQAALNRAQSGGMTCSVLLMDLNDFKKINDLDGHLVGDTVLCEVAQRLLATIRGNDMVARLGGDEFVIIAEGEEELQAHLEGAKRLADRLINAIRQPILADDAKFEIGASIGIAPCRADATNVTSLLRAADIAMYRAKQSGGSTFRFFEPSMDEEMRAQEAIEKDLVKAIDEEQIQPYFQPLVDLENNRIRGFEALARWQHPERGFIPPDVFIPIVEQLKLMPKMTESILRQACRNARQWPDDIGISVNVSPSELQDTALPNRILAILTQEQLPPTRLEVEITESALIRNVEVAKSILTTLRGFGITICLDDFGTGYSSLNHLRELKFDKIKIDRSFVQVMQENPDSAKIVDAILGLTHNLNLPAVAEGIESQDAMAFLASKGCEFGQGYYFGKAVSGDSVHDLLEKDRRQTALVA